MLVIVDGPDCAGKSTLVEAVVARLHGEHPGDEVVVHHKGPPAGHPLAEYVEPLLGYRPGQGVHVVCDRWHWGEAVYPRLYDRPTRMDEGVWRYTEMFLRSRGAVVLFPDVEPDVLRSRLAARGDDVFTRDKIPHAVTAFRYTAARSDLPVVRYRTSAPDLASRGAVDHARTREAEAVALNPFHTYVGPVGPTCLLVGDERPLRMDRDHPAFFPYAPRSGHFLLNALRGSELHNLGLVNANDVDDVRKAWETLGRPARVVALGATAHRRLTQVDVPHGAVPHPQFVRRFYQRHRDEYGRLLEQVLAHGGDRRSWRPENPSWRPR